MQCIVPQSAAVNGSQFMGVHWAQLSTVDRCTLHVSRQLELLHITSSSPPLKLNESLSMYTVGNLLWK
jgi:hypothetical protein